MMATASMYLNKKSELKEERMLKLVKYDKKLVKLAKNEPFQKKRKSKTQKSQAELWWKLVIEKV